MDDLQFQEDTFAESQNVEAGNDASLPSADEVSEAIETVLFDNVVCLMVNNGGAELPIPGQLRLVQKNDKGSVSWKPSKSVNFQTDDDLDWAVITKTAGESANDQSSQEERSPFTQYSFQFPVARLQSVRRSTAKQGWLQLSFKLHGQDPLPPLQFQHSPLSEFWSKMSRFVLLTRKSASQYEASDAIDGPGGLTSQLAETLPMPFTAMFSEENLYAGFSKVTRFVRHIGTNVGLRQASASSDQQGQIGGLSDAVYAGVTELRNWSSSSHSDMPVDARDADHQSFLVLDTSEKSPLSPYPEPVTREEHISLNEWQECLDSDGRVVKVKEFHRRLFKGGLDPKLRHHVWKFLLGYYPYDSTPKLRDEIDDTKRKEYKIMGQQRSSMLPAQLQRFTFLRDNANLISKDVQRTDRTHPRFKEDDSPYLHRLKQILLTYCFYNFDLGYVQGMSDMCSPIIDVMEDEIISFWCFAGVMDKVEGNFELSQEPMKVQLETLAAMLKLADPLFSSYLTLHDSGQLLFCFQWLLVRFKRELSYEDTMRLWEVLWSNYLTPHFHMFCALALILRMKEPIINGNMGFAEIVSYANRVFVTNKLELPQMLNEAEALCRSFMAGYSLLPPEVLKILPTGVAPDQSQANPFADAQESVMCTPEGSSVLATTS